MASMPVVPHQTHNPPPDNLPSTNKPLHPSQHSMSDDKEMSPIVIQGNDQVTGHIISTTIGGKNGEPKQTISYMAERVVGTGSFGVVFQLGGPSWSVPLGRKDARTASQSAANTNLPPPTASLATLISSFAAQGLNARDMTALSGAHTIGQARCTTFRTHIYNETNIDPNFATFRQRTCPGPASGIGDDNLAPLDIRSPNGFDNGYFQNLIARRGLFPSDQELFNGGSQDALVRLYSLNFRAFANDFVNAMIKMGNISPLTGSNGEIRKNCRVIN